ncbi:UNVERIFIED_CONTAM: Internal alternative NAD(P)H-ubiquinone oxidoreductase A1, mitochondrial [Sesamum radiatum]|uniref:Internal alternative NAD(P)H-ubiquinone oxidoreductase A1, mitochondrial n=1 Tax=Sesamum radiatum TaxID=300843 RepID=A0AAW2KH68_SESRA
MVFTPLLASTCVGTLEFRSVAEPVSQIQSALAKEPNSYFFLASCTGIDTDKHEVYCEAVGDDGRLSQEPYHFKVSYDKLVIASGAEPLTFGIKGVKEHAFFLREVTHAQEIRKRLLLNLMLCESPVWSRLVRGVVKEVHPNKLVLSDGSDVPYGLLVWSTGVGPSTFVRSLDLPKSPGGRIGIDEWLRVPSAEDVFAIGDCAGFLEHVGRPVLPALAQVAEREGKFLVELFNRMGNRTAAGLSLLRYSPRRSICLQASRKHGLGRPLQGFG